MPHQSLGLMIEAHTIALRSPGLSRPNAGPNRVTNNVKHLIFAPHISANLAISLGLPD